MVMQIFQIIPLEATKNIFINSLACFLGVTQIWNEGDWDYITFNYLRQEKKNSFKIQMYLCALLNEFMTQSLWNTVEYVAQIQGFKHQSLSTLSQLERPKASC